MKRAAIYIRVSEVTATNVAGSMEDQRAACEARAAREGWTTAPTLLYAEEGKSAYRENTLKRPRFQQMLADARARRFDVVLVHKFDRFSRKMRLYLQALEDFRAVGVPVLSVTEPSDYETAGGRFAMHNMGAAAQFFSDALSERIRARRAAEAAAGRHLGPAPVGYAHAGKGALVRVEPYDGLVVAALTLYATGQHSAARIAAELRMQGYAMPTGAHVTTEAIRRIVDNAPLYAGMVRSGEVWIPGQHEPIIDNDLAARALEVEARRSVTHSRRYPRTAEPTALLAGLCFCEACRQTGRASKMHYQIDSRGPTPWRAFRCKHRADGGDCETPYVNAAAVEAQALALCDSLALPEEWVQEALALAREQLQTPAAPARPDATTVQERMRRLGRLYADGLVTDDEYSRQLGDLRAQLAEMPAPVVRRRVTLEDVAARLRNIPTLIREGTVQERRAVLAEIVDELYITPGRIAAIRPTALYEPLVQAAHLSVMEAGH